MGGGGIEAQGSKRRRTRQGLERAVQEATTNEARALAHYSLGLFHDNNGREGEAVPHYEAGLILGLPAQVTGQALAWLASSLYKKGRPTEALALVSRAREQLPSPELRRFLEGLERRIRTIKPILRPASRLLVVDDGNRVLLFAAEDGVRRRPLWFPPGGGLETGEIYEQAALRELKEETGLSGVPLGPWVWNRREVWRAGDIWYDQTERFYLIKTAGFQVDLSGHTELERRVMKGYRWWSLGELAAATNITLAPRRLLEFLRPLLEGTVPTEPVDVGV